MSDWVFDFSVALRPQRPYRLLGTGGAQNLHLDFVTAPELWVTETFDSVTRAHCSQSNSGLQPPEHTSANQSVAINIPPRTFLEDWPTCFYHRLKDKAKNNQLNCFSTKCSYRVKFTIRWRIEETWRPRRTNWLLAVCFLSDDRMTRSEYSGCRRSKMKRFLLACASWLANRILTYKGSERTLFIRTKHNMRIFGVIPFIVIPYETTPK